MNILLVEDDRVDVMAVQRVFEENHIEQMLHVASNGVEALEMLRGEQEKQVIDPPMLILLDLKMPKMDGVEFLRRLRSDEDPRISRIPVIVLTYSTLESERSAINALGVSGYFNKSGEFDEFVKVLTKFCSSSS
jgi:CheY-like chemotaxis protein